MRPGRTRQFVNMADHPTIGIAKYLRLAVLVGFVLGFSCSARAADPNPLIPLDTSSPRASLLGFIGTVDGIYTGMKDVLDEYARSDQLYLTKKLRKEQIGL